MALHVLLHMSELDRPVTSDELAPMMKTNPVVFRRTMAGLRDAGIVQSEKGHGGGWSLARDLDAITLADCHAALGGAPAFNMGHRDANPRCLLEKAVNEAVAGTLAEAEALLIARFDAITMKDILTDARRKAARTAKKEWHGHV